MDVLAYYVSGHGFGHARRTAEVLKAVVRLRPEIRVVVRTTAPPALFAGIESVRVSAPKSGIDPGVVEKELLTIDGEASIARLGQVLRRSGRLIDEEARFIQDCGAGPVVSDVAFLAGEAAERAGVACWGVGNFTWDWIYAHYAKTAEHHEWIARVKQAYGKTEGLLHLPLGHAVDCFKSVVEMPLVAGRAVMRRGEVLRALGILEGDERKRVLVAMRGGVSMDVLKKAAGAAEEMLFLTSQEVGEDGPANLMTIRTDRAIDFTEILAVCDVAVSKVGYGILADCIANRVGLVYPPRTGFGEDAISLQECPRYMRMVGIDVDAFFAGEWGEALREVVGMDGPKESLDCSGDEKVARAILSRMGRRD